MQGGLGGSRRESNSLGTKQHKQQYGNPSGRQADIDQGKARSVQAACATGGGCYGRRLLWVSMGGQLRSVRNKADRHVRDGAAVDVQKLQRVGPERRRYLVLVALVAVEIPVVADPVDPFEPEPNLGIDGREVVGLGWRRGRMGTWGYDVVQR